MAEVSHRVMPLPGTGPTTFALGAAALGGLAWVAPQTLAPAALSAWIFALSVTAGAALWLLITQLTGGNWTRAAGRMLAALSRATPLVAFAGIPLYVAGSQLYPWWAGIEGLRGEIYLVPWSFALRGVVILSLWSLIGWLAPQSLPAPLAALLLIGYGISIGIAGVDWILSRDPDMLSTTFGMLLAAMQLGLALAVPAALGLERHGHRATSDWGALLLACCLGSFYLGAMQFLVSWSGNLPVKAAWYGARTDGSGTTVMTLVVLSGVVVPLALLIRSAHRGDPRTLRHAGTCASAAGLLHLVWLCCPDSMLLSLLGAVAMLAIGSGLATIYRRARHG